jgi:hypothetical protein
MSQLSGISAAFERQSLSSLRVFLSAWSAADRRVPVKSVTINKASSKPHHCAALLISSEIATCGDISSIEMDGALVVDRNSLMDSLQQSSDFAVLHGTSASVSHPDLVELSKAALERACACQRDHEIVQVLKNNRVGDQLNSSLSSGTQCSD